ncbi:MAG TPA: lipase maturation factor family protein [Acidimicrobiia bacterium]|jgi:hypothetical protein|nr:lipase maturation factor family protein [Acidimicrobiia bacterium]
MEWFSAPESWLARLLVQRGLAAIYLVAFLVAVNQFRPLLGERGLLPVPRFVAAVPLRRSPSLFHLHYSDRFFAVVAWSGVALSAAALAGLAERAPLWVCMLIWLVLWALYLSIVNVGQTFYSFGWETLLLEAGFLAVFLGPSDMAPPAAVLWLFRWLVFRLEFGAGLIKLRGDRCWRDLTCLDYHHETQPMPNPLSWFFHRLPKPLHKVEVLANYFAQLVAPVGLLAPQPVAGIAAAVVIVTQAWLVASGNFSWLNWAAIVLACSALSDPVLDRLLPVSAPATLHVPPGWYQAVVLIVMAVVAVLSYRPVRNLVSRRQLMNTSFEPLHLVNTYGAFGSVTRVRREVVIEATVDDHVGPDTEWQEYELKGKPGDPRRRPPQVAPYHLRLDWLMWFAALSPRYAEPWFLALVGKLLENDPATGKLFRRVPFGDRPPTYIRTRLYEYRFTTWRERRATGAWWQRTLVGDYLPPITLRRVGAAASTEPT